MSFKLTKPGGATKTSPTSGHLATAPGGGAASMTTANPHHRRSLRERLRDGIQSTTAGIPLPSFQTKSHSVDSKSIPGPGPAPGGVAPPPGGPPVDQFITVSDRDTLTSLAAKYNSTPNELIRLNRLNSRFIFPGQKLKVPEKESGGCSASGGQGVGGGPNQQHLLRSQSNSVFDDADGGLDPDEDLEIRQKKFIKLKVRHVTDGNGVVSGTLLITPNAIMFDPNVSDPLVLDQGAEIYGIILPIELVVSAAIFNDISNMRVKQSFIEPVPNTNVVLYKPLFSASTGTSTSSPFKKPAAPAEASAHAHEQFTSHSMTCSQLQLSLSPLPLGKEEKTNILKRFSFPLTSAISSTSDFFGGGAARATSGSVDSEVAAGTAAPTAATDPELEPELEKTDDVYSDTEQWYLCLTTGYPVTAGEAAANSNSKTSRHTTAITPISYGQKKHLKPEYWFSVSAEEVDGLYCFWNIWWPHLYGLVDPGLIASRGFALIDWTTDLSLVLNNRGTGSGISGDRRMTTSASSGLGDDFGEKVAAQAQQINELTKESWEMIKAPYGKLYSFLQRGQTILTSTTSCDSNYGSTSSASGGGAGGGPGGLTVLNSENEFEIVSMSELDGRSCELLADFVPELVGGPSLILKTEGHVTALCKNLTARAEGYPWWLVFCTETNGFSLGSLYRRMETVDEWSPILLVVEDTQENIFGALISSPLKLSEHFYGTGQSFLFNFNNNPDPGDEPPSKFGDLLTPEVGAEPGADAADPPPPVGLNIHKWTGENLFFMKGNAESLSIGAGDGKFGLWLDSDLFVGRTDSCSTYGNPPLVPAKDFIVKTLEAWAFGGVTGNSGSTATTMPTSFLLSSSTSSAGSGGTLLTSSVGGAGGSNPSQLMSTSSSSTA